MSTYGDRVQFALTGTGQRPNYQIINAAGKKIAFDNNNHLLHPKADEFIDNNATRVFTLDQLKTAMASDGIKTSSGTRVGIGGGRRTAAAVNAMNQVDSAKYEYFKNNRQALPPGIGEHSEEVTTLMKQGMSAEDAFGEVVKRHF